MIQRWLKVVLCAALLFTSMDGWAKSKRRSKRKMGKKPVVEFTVASGKATLGKIRLELDPDKAPKTVANFLQYVRAGHYQGTIFHRVIDSFMIQGGGYSADYQKKSARAPIKNEADNGLKNLRGTIAMARTMDPHSAAAQFFINVKDNAFLDHRAKDMRGWGYCVFGNVIKGMDVVDKIKKMATGAKGPFPKDVPLKEVVIKKAQVL